MKMNKESWLNQIKVNFDSAASNYSRVSSIQKHFSEKIVISLKNLLIPRGKWFDLGSGTGFLADQIEEEFPNQIVNRIDFSEKMLLMHKANKSTILWDLNLGLPQSTKGCSLLVSNFCLHWLNDPCESIKIFYSNLMKGGFLIISYPTNKCFPEWKETCKKCNIEFSGLGLPDSAFTQNSLNGYEIISSKNYNYIENFSNIYKLFRNIIDMGAHSTKSKRKTVNELKTLQKFWPKDTNNRVNLTWEINILIVKKR